MSQAGIASGPSDLTTHKDNTMSSDEMAVAPVGRPTDYRPEFAEQAAKLCELGATDYELADFFGVSTVTIYRWKNTREEFCNAVKVGKEKADDRVERALYNRAVGYSFESVKVMSRSLGNNSGSVIEHVPVVEHVPPDAGAALNWLKNRRGDAWQEKSSVDHTGSITVVSGVPRVEDN